MEQIERFQAYVGAPVMTVLGNYWPFFLIMILIICFAFFSGGQNRGDGSADGGHWDGGDGYGGDGGGD